MTGADRTASAGPAGAAATPHGDAGPQAAALVAAGLRDVADFPQPGVLFKDIVPLLADAQRFAASVEALAALCRAAGGADLIAGVEARGFVLAAALAQHLGLGLVPIRKAGKLPPPVVARDYTLEYGTATIEAPVGVLEGRRVYLVDDVLATGGTLRAAAELIAQAGGEVTGLGVLLEIGVLGGRDALAGLAGLGAVLVV